MIAWYIESYSPSVPFIYLYKTLTRTENILHNILLKSKLLVLTDLQYDDFYKTIKRLS